MITHKYRSVYEVKRYTFNNDLATCDFKEALEQT